MRTSSGVLMATRKRKSTTEFACYVRNLTPAAVTLQVPLGLAETEPRMTKAAHEVLRDRSRKLLAEPLRLAEGATGPVVARPSLDQAPPPATPTHSDPSKPTEGW
jgi:hypothetical protein